MKFFNRKKLFLLFLISLIATLGSLYFSEIKYFTPCKLCWYQRISMYPIVIISLVGFLFNKKDVFMYILPLASVGILISSLHVILQKNWLAAAGKACSDNLCAISYVNYFGFFSIPTLAWIAFFMIIVLCFMLAFRQNK